MVKVPCRNGSTLFTTPRFEKLVWNPRWIKTDHATNMMHWMVWTVAWPGRPRFIGDVSVVITFSLANGGNPWRWPGEGAVYNSHGIIRTWEETAVGARHLDAAITRRPRLGRFNWQGMSLRAEPQRENWGDGPQIQWTEKWEIGSP